MSNSNTPPRFKDKYADFEKHDKLLESKGYGWSNAHQSWRSDHHGEYDSNKKYEYMRQGDNMFKVSSMSETPKSNANEKKNK